MNEEYGMPNAEYGVRFVDETIDGRVEEFGTAYARDAIPRRARQFAIAIVKAFRCLTNTIEASVIGRQFLRSGTSVGAHLHEAQRARSIAEMLSKVEVALQELNETDYWLVLASDAGLLSSKTIDPLRSEIDELTRILVQSAKTLRQRRS